eukprot:scaffold81159_cov40-Tisochrysis_lutea.AAC.1
MILAEEVVSSTSLDQKKKVAQTSTPASLPPLRTDPTACIKGRLLRLQATRDYKRPTVQSQQEITSEVWRKRGYLVGPRHRVSPPSEVHKRRKKAMEIRRVFRSTPCLILVVKVERSLAVLSLAHGGLGCPPPALHCRAHSSFPTTLAKGPFKYNVCLVMPNGNGCHAVCMCGLRSSIVPAKLAQNGLYLHSVSLQVDK